MKKTLFLIFMAIGLLVPGVMKAQNHRTYYDDAKTKLKEVYAVKEYTELNPDDPANPVAYTKKEGPYFYYYETGKLKISGEYKNDQKSGTWNYYDETGNLTKTEKYVNGKLVP